MSKVVNGRIVLDKEESKNLLKDIFHPDEEALKKRDAFLEDTKNWIIQRLGNGRTIIDIPDLELPSFHASPSKSNTPNKYSTVYSEQNTSNIPLHTETPLTSTFLQHSNIDRLDIDLPSFSCVVVIIPLSENRTCFMQSDSLPTSFSQFKKAENSWLEVSLS